MGPPLEEGKGGRKKKKSGRTQTFRLAPSNLKLLVPIVHIAVCVCTDEDEERESAIKKEQRLDPCRDKKTTTGGYVC